MYHSFFCVPTHSLLEKDFGRFFTLFSRCLTEKYFSFSKLVFISDPSEIEECFESKNEIDKLKVLFQHAVTNQEIVQKFNKGLLVPFPTEDSTVVAVITNVDAFLLKKASGDWLIEMRDSALSEFVQIKQAHTDTVTGLPNLNHLYHVLDSCGGQNDLHLMLVELYPYARNARNAFLHSRKAALALDHFFNGKYMIHHIGQGVFAILTTHLEHDTHSRMGAALLNILRREKFKKVHVGCSHSQDMSSSLPQRLLNNSLIDRAWEALQISSKRGPFSYCEYGLLAHPDKHPLRKPSKSIIAKFQKKWRIAEKFSVIQLKVDNVNDHLQFQNYIHEFETDLLVQDGTEFYIYIEGIDATGASLWIVEQLKKIKDMLGYAISISIGIANFPHINFGKAEIVMNCHKALLHAEFFGPDSTVVFDHVSLNISGDVFYGDGDFFNAIKEYKRGLLIETENVNLLNSLGVAYAVIERSKDAHSCFEKALQVDNTNFMALYNLGLGDDLQGDDESALERFQHAAENFSRDEKNTTIVSDLYFHLGKLYCKRGMYSKSLEILRPWYLERENENRAGRALRYLGWSSLLGFKDTKEAMKWFQKALQFDEFDAVSMGLLGRVYQEAGEGDDIALSLCSKSVELEPRNKFLVLQLAKVQKACGQIRRAKRNLRKCVDNKVTKIEAQYQLGCIYENEGKNQHARTWFSKLQKEATVNEEILHHIKEFERYNNGS